MNASASRSFRAALCALLACGLVACGKQESAIAGRAGSVGTGARALVVGTDAAYAPFESQNEKGEIVGFDIDIVKAVAQKAG
jgi:polar amino acid transport system substrate-binding protein